MHLTLPKSQQRTDITNRNINHWHVFCTLCRNALNDILLNHVLHCSPIFPLFYFTSYYIYPYTLPSTFPTSLYQTWNLWQARWGITIYRRIKKHALREHLHVHCRRQPIFIAYQMFEHPMQASSIVLEIANVQGIILKIQDNDNINRENRNDESVYPAVSTWSADIKEDDLDIQQELLHLDQARQDKTIRTTSVPLWEKWSHADNVVAHAPLPNLRHSAGAVAPTLVRCQKSVINISRESDVVQAQPLPLARRDQNIPQLMASGDYNVSEHRKVAFEVAKRFMEEMVFTKICWQIISDEMYSMVKKVWKLPIEAQHGQRTWAGAPVGTSSVCQLRGASLKINQQTQDTVSVYSVFLSSIGLMMIQNLETYIVKTKH